MRVLKFRAMRFDHRVQMKLVAQGRPTSPEAEIALAENYIFPSLEMFRKLREEKKILAGGPISGTIGIAMIVEAAFPLELDGIVESVPVWPLMETSVTPLTTFEDRIRAISPHLERAKADAHKWRTADLWRFPLKCRWSRSRSEVGDRTRAQNNVPQDAPPRKTYLSLLFVDTRSIGILSSQPRRKT